VNKRKLVSFLFIAILYPSLAFSASIDKEAAEKYEQALVAQQNKEIKTAIIHLKNALQINNNYIAAHILLGKLYLEQNQGALAEKELDKANALGADRSLTVIPLAKSYQQQFKYKDVIEKIFPVGYSRSISAQLYVLQGQAYNALKSFKDAEAAFIEAQKLDPDSVDAPLGLAATFLQQGKFSKAKAYLKQAQALGPSDPEVWYIQGSIFHATGDLEKAESYYSKVIDAKPDHISALVARAGVFIDQQKIDQAYRDVTKIRTLNPKDPRAAYFQAVLLAKNKDNNGSRKALMEASGIIDSLSKEAILHHSPSLLLAGLVKFSLGEYESAEDYLSNYVRLYPHNPSVRKLLGSTLLKKQEYHRAISVLSPALKVIPNDYKLLTMLGTAYMHVNKHTQAAEMFDKALMLGKQDYSIRFESALNQLASGNQDGAIDQLTSLFSEPKSRNNTNDKAGILLAMLYIKNANLAKALNILNSVMDQQPNNITIRNLYASTLLATGEITQAKSILDQIIASTPELLSARINRIKIDIFENRLNSAEQELQSLLKKHPSAELVMQQLAIISSRRGDEKSAQRWLEKAYAKNPKSITASVNLIEYYLSVNAAQKAVNTAEEIESKHAENLKIMDALGRSYLAAGKFKSAQAVFKRMSLIANYNSPVLHRIAKLQLQSKDTDNAIWSLRKAIAGDKQHLPSYVLLTDVLIRNNKLRLAQKEANNIVKKFPEKAQGYGLLGDIALAGNNTNKAIQYYKKSLDIQATARATVQLSQAFLHANRKKDAENTLKKWLRKTPEDAAVRQGLAEFYLANGNKIKAAKQYQILIKSGLENAQILNNLAMIYADSDKSLALKYAKKALKLAPSQASVIDTVGWLLVKNGHFQEGLTYLRDANARQSNNAEIHYHIAVALYALGRQTEAIQEIKTAIESKQNFEGLSKAKHLLLKWEKN